MKQFLSTILGQSDNCPPSNKSGSMGTYSRHVGILLLLSGFLLLYQEGYSQVSGAVFRDFNGNGTKDTNEPFVSGITVNAYNTAGTLCGSATTSGNTAPNYSLSGCGTEPVRVEFVLPTSGSCVQSGIDFTGLSGATYGTSVQFVNGNSTNVNFALHNPDNYNTGTSGAATFVPIYVNGNPLGGGTSGASDWFVGFPYTSSGTTTPPRRLNGTAIGSVWGGAYSKQAGKIFTSAFIKRHVGLGPLGSGGIYLLTPTASSFTVANFYDMDANGHRTRAASGAPSYGNTTSFQISGADNNIITYLGSNDLLTGEPSGLGVVGVNGTGGRSLPAAGTSANFDPAAFGQVGKVGLGGLEISDDGKYLFVMNLYSRKVFRLELNDAVNPVSVVNVTSYDLPSVTCNNGKLRPFALKFYRNKLYIGAVCSGENGGQNTVNGTTDLYAYVFEMTDPTGSPSVNSTPVISYPLNYLKGAARPQRPAPFNATQWYPWTNNTGSVLIPPSNNQGTYPSPMLTDLDFTDRGDLIMSFTDRGGHVWGTENYQHLSGSTSLFSYIIGGDILIAGVNCTTGAYSLESNGAFTSNGAAFSSSGGVGNSQGPGGGEFFDKELYSTNHYETNMGSFVNVFGAGDILTTIMDPTALNTGGTRIFSTTNGDIVGAGYQLYELTPNFGKANGLGEIEFIGTLPPLEIGNRVWNDTNADGIQDADELGINSITILLFEGATQVGSTTTSNGGQYYFNNSNVNQNGASGIKPKTNYVIHIPSGSFPAGQTITTANVGGAGQPDVRDSDATLVGGNAEIAYTTGDYGQNDHTLDFGFKPACNLGVTASGTPVSCNGGNNGTITLTVTDANSSVTYLWNDGVTDQNRTDLTAATYSVTVTELPGCTATTSFEVTQPDALEVTCSHTNVTTNGGSDGTASVSASGGTTPYTYLWSNGATTDSISGLTASTYSVTVTDANGCTATCNVMVQQPNCPTNNCFPTGATKN